MLVNGCRPATQHDFLELADRVTGGVDDWEKYAERLSAMLIEMAPLTNH